MSLYYHYDNRGRPCFVGFISDMPAMAEPKPSAANVGCEFVRQYYTMLNKDPRQVHRFYSKDSVFFHGGAGNLHSHQPVVGQEVYNVLFRILCKTKTLL